MWLKTQTYVFKSTKKVYRPTELDYPNLRHIEEVACRYYSKREVASTEGTLHYSHTWSNILILCGFTGNEWPILPCDGG